MKKFTSIITALIAALLLCLTAFAEDEGIYYVNTGDYYAVLLDFDDSLTAEEEQSVLNMLVYASIEYNMNTGVIITNDVGSDNSVSAVMEYADAYYNSYFGADTDGTLLVLNNNSYINWVTASGIYKRWLENDLSEFFSNVADEVIDYDYVGAASVYLNTISDFSETLDRESIENAEQQQNAETAPVSDTNITDTAQINWGSETDEGIYTAEIGGNIALLHDLDDSLTQSEEEKAAARIAEAVKYTDFSICVVITDNIGEDKSDREVIDYADVYYENYCGINTDGILLLLNNDTKYDWISTSGNCIDMFYYNIDPIFDNIYDYIVDGEFDRAIINFCSSVEYYSNQDYVYYSDYGDDYSGFSDEYGDYYINDISWHFFGFMYILPFAVIVIIIVIVILKSVIKSNYTIKKNKNAQPYQLKNSLSFSQKSDTYIRTYTTRTRVSSSSSSGRSGGGRSHRSSGGGRHGGGGRRR